MIKEMGDGFLCSVGFPFKQVDQLKSVSALNLAEEIIDQFHLCISSIGTQEPVFCAVGIAKGMVSSYFSTSGRVKYDLWGHGIVLATRYEGMRKIIFANQKHLTNHILILQESVFESLPDEKRQRFKVLDLAAANLKVRDDPAATRLAYKVYEQSDESLEIAA